jgi:membrane-bound ClpP family serine protease
VSDYLIWAFALIGFATLLFVLEILIPSGGIIGLLALCAAIGAVVAFSFESLIWGGVSLAGLLVMVPLAINFALRVFPNTPVGKKLILGEDVEDEEELARLEEQRREEEQRRQALIGAEGTTVTPLRPGGSVKIDGVTIEATSEVGMIEVGVPIKVTKVDAFGVRVRPQ